METVIKIKIVDKYDGLLGILINTAYIKEAYNVMDYLLDLRVNCSIKLISSN